MQVFGTFYEAVTCWYRWQGSVMTDTVDQNQQYDLSFAYCFHWESPERQIREALKVLLFDAMTETQAKSEQNSQERESKRSAQDEAANIRWLLAINPNTPPPVLEHLSRDRSTKLLERIAENPRAHTTTLSKLSCHTDPQVRASVAENPALSIKTVWRLARDENPDVRLRLAESYSVPIAVLKVLAFDENPYVSFRAQLTIRKILGEVQALRSA